ncbi:MAG: metallophosphoesterase family protein [Deltaproteobacteria bacterium]|nr:metallophosphoesterase family protein [Deltaproteobacteria bacterium]
MRIAVTSDIHVDKNGPGVLRALASRVAELQPDVLVLAGDVATPLPTLLEALLSLRPCAREMVFVAGNHDVWSHPLSLAQGVDAWTRLDRLIPALCQEAGVHDLDTGPVVIDGVGFVGTLGWWDLSMRDEALGAPEDAYQRGEFGGLRWMDHVFARFRREGEDMPYAQVAVELRERLRAQLQAVNADRVVGVTHMVQFPSQLAYKSHPGWRFCQGFIGHRSLGEMLAADERVVLSACGHTHSPSDQQIGRLRAVCSPLGYRGEWLGRPDVQAVERAVSLVEL